MWKILLRDKQVKKKKYIYIPNVRGSLGPITAAGGNNFDFC